MLFLILAIIGTSPTFAECLKETTNQVWIEGATFQMGSDDTYPEERFEHKVTVDGFWMDVHEITNKQFAKFVEETGYVTVAERTPDPELIKGAPEEMFKPGSIVFTPPGDKINS